MSMETSIQQLRRKAYLAYHRDGIIDILIGVSILGFGLWQELNIPLFAFACLFAFGMYVPLKNAITVPRFGYVRFSEGKRESSLIVGIALGVCLLGLAFAVLTIIGPDRTGLGAEGFIRKHHPFVMSSIGGVLMAFFGLWGGIHRLVGYALFLLVAVWVSFGLGFAGSLPLLLSGMVMMVTGLVQLVAFLRRYSEGSGEGNHGA
jgi:hypothetical protein